MNSKQNPNGKRVGLNLKELVQILRLVGVGFLCDFIGVVVTIMLVLHASLGAYLPFLNWPLYDPPGLYAGGGFMTTFLA